MNATLQRYCTCIFLCMVTVVSGVVFGADPPEDVIHAQLIPPEILIQHREEIGLTQKQVEQIQAYLQEVGPQAAEFQRKLEPALGQLARILSAAEIDESAAITQLDEVLESEAALKRVHLRLMIRVKNVLSADQQLVAAKIKQEPRGEGLQRRLQGKLSRIEREMKRRVEAGDHPFEIANMMQKFPEHMQAGRHTDAEALLDRVMRRLDIAKSSESTQTQKDPLPKDQSP